MNYDILKYEGLLQLVKEQEKEIERLKLYQNGERKNLFQTLFTDSYSIKLIIDLLVHARNIADAVETQNLPVAHIFCKHIKTS